MIDTLISSRTRVKLLLKFFLSEGTEGYLRGLQSELGDSSNGIRVELNRLAEAGMLESSTEGNRKVFRANRLHPLYEPVRAIVRKHVGLDRIIETVANNLGSVEEVYLTGSFSRGLDGPFIDLVLVGEIDRAYLVRVVEKAENLIGRKIRTVVYSVGEVKSGGLESIVPRPVVIWRRADEAS